MNDIGLLAVYSGLYYHVRLKRERGRSSIFLSFNRDERKNCGDLSDMLLIGVYTFQIMSLKNHLSVMVHRSIVVKSMADDRSLQELPDRVYVALGRRGMEPLPLKECTYDCDGKELKLIKPPDNQKIPEKGNVKVDEDWLVECEKCNRQFTIRCKIHYLDGEKLETMVNIIDDSGKDLGWLGSY